MHSATSESRLICIMGSTAPVVAQLYCAEWWNSQLVVASTTRDASSGVRRHLIEIDAGLSPLFHRAQTHR